MLDKHCINYGTSLCPALLYHSEPGTELLRDPHTMPYPLVPIPHSGLGGQTFTVPKSSSLMWPPPNSFFTVARVAAYSIFSRT